MHTFWNTFTSIIHIFVCLVLMFVVLLQQGKGGGMGAAFGGATTQVFGGRGAGNILTRATAICAATFMLTSVALAYQSSAGDRALKAADAKMKEQQNQKGTKRDKSESPPPSSAAAPSGAAVPSGAPVAPTAPASSGSGEAPKP